MMRNEAQKGLTSADIKSICDAAKAAWNVASDRARRVVFTWRGRRYVSTLSSFKMKVDTMQGEPVAARYH
jgi:hypothetical protein